MLQRHLQRARALLVDPRAEVVRAVGDAPSETSRLVYVALLAGAGALAGFLAYGVLGEYHPGEVVFNMRTPAVWARAPLIAAVIALTRAGLGVGAFYALGFALAILGPTFGARRDAAQARAVAALALTPIFVAQLLEITVAIPYFGWLRWLGAILGVVWSATLAVWAVPTHLGTPEPKALGHALSALGATLFLLLLAYWLVPMLVVVALT